MLAPVKGTPTNYDDVYMFVVRAEDERRARMLAGAKAGAKDDHFWFDEKRSQCTRLDVDGPPAVLVREVMTG